MKNQVLFSLKNNEKVFLSPASVVIGVLRGKKHHLSFNMADI